MDSQTILLFSALLLEIIITRVFSTEEYKLVGPSCSSEIYCYGNLLHTIQMSEIFPDSKTFVDMKMKQSPKKTLKLFEDFMKQTENNPSPDEIREFVDNHFDPAGSEFMDWKPSDWCPEPKFLEKISDRLLRGWAKHLHELWVHLGRKMKPDVDLNPELYSIIPVPFPMIVPGGRFREFYYWDSYWSTRGLLHSEMYTTVRGMLNNFVSIIDRFGFIPNGGRVYYSMRSQPPFFTQMVGSYIEFTKDHYFLKKNIDSIEKEFQFWMHNRTVTVEKNGKTYKLCRYMESSFGPRPESYREDFYTVSKLEETMKDQCYSQLKSAAESGWDFSSRWFIDPNDTKSLTTINIKSIIPVDLNAYIYKNAKLLADFYQILNRTEKVEEYNAISNEWLEAVTEILWHPEIGSWLDYDMLNRKERNDFYTSNLVPLWTGCYDKLKTDHFTENILKYIKKNNILFYLGGIPVSLSHTGEQWDYPNAWPPLEHMLIMGFDSSGNEELEQIAFNLAKKWVTSNFKAYNDTKAMYEKYDATVFGSGGGGGEYEVQVGFGWTNGVILELLERFGDRIFISNPVKEDGKVDADTNSGITLSTNHLGSLITLLLAVSATLTAGFIGAIVYSKRHSTADRLNRSDYVKLPGASGLK